MSNRTKFQEKWLKYIDCNDTLVSDWAKKSPQDPYTTFCLICNATFSSDKGFEKLQQHAQSLKPSQVTVESGVTSRSEPQLLKPKPSTSNQAVDIVLYLIEKNPPLEQNYSGVWRILKLTIR